MHYEKYLKSMFVSFVVQINPNDSDEECWSAELEQMLKQDLQLHEEPPDKTEQDGSEVGWH